MKILEHLRIAFKEAFSRPEGWLAAAAGFFLVLVIAMTFSSWNLLQFIFRDDQFSAALKVRSSLETIWGGRLALHEHAWTTYALALAFGLNVALIERYVRRQAQLHQAAGASLLGILVGILGIGCAACGSAVLASLLGVGATLGVLSALPFHGREFSWLGIFLVLLSTFSLAKKIAEPQVCGIPAKK